jgi:serine/threonine-protein kinase
MTTETLHPDLLKPGDMVGAWQLVGVLGQGGTSRVFKVKRNECFYTLKMALNPISTSEEEKHSTEEQALQESVHRRLAREVSTLLLYSSHPNLLRVYAVDIWPNPDKGYPYLVTKFVDGETWHEWRWRTRPTASALTDAFTEVVRTVGALHSRGVYHRDLKAENILIRREDGRVFVIDLGSARLSSAVTKTLGLPEGALHLVPPELLAYTRNETWKRGEPFNWGVAAELYTLGVLLYQGLTDHHPFDPKLPDAELLAAIASVPPTPPHVLNPRAPRALSDIAMKLLEKRPEDRYANTEALLQALWRTGKERPSHAWKVPLLEPGEALAEPEGQTDEGHSIPEPEAPGGEPAALPLEGKETPEEVRQEPPAIPRRARWPGVLLACLMLLCLGLWLARATLAPRLQAMPPASTEKEVAPMPTSAPPQAPAPSGSSPLLTIWLCAAFGLGCPGAQVKPPEPSDCPDSATQAMFQELKIRTGSDLQAVVDLRQPGDFADVGVYQDGPLISRVSRGDSKLTEGTLLYGYLWTGPGIYDREASMPREAVLGRYTEAVLPDGTKYPVCIVLGGRDGRVPKVEGSKPGAARLARALPISAVRRWP